MDKQQRIDKRIAVKDAMFFTLNASNAAASILSALIPVLENKPKDVVHEFEKLRDELLKSNLEKAEDLKGEDLTETSAAPF